MAIIFIPVSDTIFCEKKDTYWPHKVVRRIQGEYSKKYYRKIQLIVTKRNIVELYIISQKILRTFRGVDVLTVGAMK